MNSKILIAKLQLMQLEIMMHHLRDLKSDRADACSHMMSKAFDRVDIQYLQDQGFTRFIAIFYRIKGYYMQWVADQTFKMFKIADKCKALHNYRLANQYLTIASKQFKEVDLKERSQKINETISSNFNRFDTVDHRKIMDKNLICCMYSMPLIRNKKAINDVYEYDIDRYLAFINNLKELAEQERIIDEIKF